MRILKGLFKIMVLPVVLVLGLFSALGNGFMKVSCYILGPVLLFLVGCIIYGFVTQTWYNVGIAIACVAGVFLITFIGAFVMAQADNLKDYLLHL